MNARGGNSTSGSVIFGVVSVVRPEHMWMPRALLVVCVVALIIVSCLVGLYVAGILRRRGMFSQRDPNGPGGNSGYPSGYEFGWQQAPRCTTSGTPVAYSCAAATPTWQYPAPNAYGAQQGYSGQPWAAQQHSYPPPYYPPGTAAPKNVAPLYPV
nr:uncharacterized protein LOC119180719 [Rhipicephalus microplus]XP_037288140.1 uncharacterized protein LOC119181069 [Rhipicephalus microplus]